MIKYMEENKYNKKYSKSKYGIESLYQEGILL